MTKRKSKKDRILDILQSILNDLNSIKENIRSISQTLPRIDENKTETKIGWIIGESIVDDNNKNNKTKNDKWK